MRVEEQAVRNGKWKLHFPHKFHDVAEPGQNGSHGKTRFTDIELALYNLEKDPGEKNHVADKYPNIVAKLSRLADKMREDLGHERVAKTGNGRREPGKI